MRPLLAGTGSTDHQLIDGLYAFTDVPGHEFVRVVESGTPHLAGRWVVAEINLPCGTCEPCRAGRAEHCTRRQVLGIRGRAALTRRVLWISWRVFVSVSINDVRQ